MQTRQNSYIDLDNLWLTLFEAIKTHSKAIDFLLDELIMHLDKGKYKKEAHRFIEIYKKMGEPLPSHPIFFLDQQEENSHDTLLILAVKNQNYKVAAKLLEMGAMLHFENYQHETALNEALKTNDIEMAEILLPFGLYFNRKILYIHLHQLGQAQKNWLALFRKYNIDLSAPDSSDYTAMHYAIIERDFALIRLLLSDGMKFNFDFVLTFFFSNKEHQKPWVDFFIEIKNLDSIDHHGFNALHYCILSKNIDAMKALILAGAKVTQDNIDSLYKNNLGEIINLLFESFQIQPDPQKIVDSIYSSTVAEAKCWSNLLVKTKHVNINNTEHKVSALILMIRQNDTDSVFDLINYGADVHAPNGRISAIQFAMQQDNLDIALKLAKHGATFSEKEVMDTLYAKQKPLYTYNSKWLDLIIDKKGDLNTRDSRYQETPIIIAVYLNDVDRTLQLLAIDSKPINAKNKTGESALFHAIKNQNLKIIHALLSYGAEIESLECTRTEIFEIIKKQIDSDDPSIRYAAVSCLTELYEKSCDMREKLTYEELLVKKGGSIEKELNEACSLFPKEIVMTVISPFLLFRPKIIVKDETPNPAPRPWQSL